MNIGSAIRSIRRRKGITIPQLCEATGLSKGFISNVENNKTSPSIATLEAIANFLNVPITYLLMSEEERMKVIRKDERKRKTFGADKLTIEYLTKSGPLRVMIVESEPGERSDEKAHSHEGYEVHLVLRGRFLIEHGEDSMIVEKGDSFSWNASIPHFVQNIGEDTGKILIALYSEERM